MPPAAGLRPNPAPLGDQQKGTKGGDLLAARHEGSQTDHRGARRKSVPCTPAPGPAGWNPRREEITTQHGARESNNLGKGGQRASDIRATRSG